MSVKHQRRACLSRLGGLAALGLGGPLAGATTGLGFFVAGLARAGALPQPTGAVVLSVTGSVTQQNVAARADFDMAMLAALPQHTFTTSTPWFREPKKFTGPLLRDVLAAAGATGTSLKAVALNDYKVTIPRADADTFDMVMARLLDDQPMTVRAKGPLFIVYPFDSKPNLLQSDLYYNRSAWQLRSLEVL